MKKITLQDIAKELGISKGTVDRALHDRPDISPVTKKKVLNLVEQYGYKPDKLARSLSLKSKKIQIGVILQTWPGFFWNNIEMGMKAAQMELLGNNMEIEFKELENGRDTQAIIKAVDYFMEKNVDSIVLVPVNNDNVREKINEACEKNITVTTLNDDIYNSKRLFYVGPQMRHSGKIMGELMGKLMRGRGNVLIVNCSIESLDLQERVEGFNEVIRQNYPQIDIVNNYIYNINNVENDHDLVLKDLLTHINTIDGIYNVDGAYLYNIANTLKDCPNYKDIILIGHEMWDGVREMMMQGVIDACVSQDPYSQGYFMIKLLYNYLAYGEKPKYDRLYTRLDIILKENAIIKPNIINPYYMSNI